MLLVKNKLYFGTLLVALACVSLAAGSNLVKRQANDQKRVVCYYANWAVYRQGLAKFSPQNINPYLCTHLIYAFGGLQKDDTLAPFDKYQDLEKSGYSRFAALKTYNKELKTMLAIGGWNEASKKFSPMVEDPQRRNKFIKSAIRFLRQYNFDGIDLDWEYPTQRKGGRPQDRENYAKLIEEMRDSFEREADQTGKDRLIISMAVPASLEITAKGFDVRSINKNLDFFNILAYDYHSSFEPAVNHHAPLFRTKEISEFDYRSDLNIESTIKYYIGHGASPDKLVLGIPTYGRSYKLLNPDAHTIGSPTDGPGTQGNGTKEDGYLAYYEICNGIKEQDWEVVNENRGSVGPYAHHDTFWVGYDDMDIVKEKAYYVAEEGLGGIMFWTIDNDDFRGTCHNEPYPLIEAAKRALYSSSAQSSDRPRSLSGKRTTTPTPPTTPSPEPSFVCTDEGFFPHSKSCKKYYWCLDAAGVGMVAHTFTCPQGLFFNSLTDGCDFKRNVDCENKSQNEEVEVQSTTTEPNQPSNPNDKSVQDILEEIKEAGGLEAFEEKLQEEEEEKKGLKQRTKVRNEGISNKTRNRFSQILERKKPKTSEPSTSSDSSSSETKQPGSLLSRLSNRRRNSLKSSDTKLEAESPSTTSLPSSTSSTTSPTRSGFIRNRNRPSFLRNKPTTSAPKPEEALEEENEVTPIERPRNSQFRNRIRNNERTPFRNRGSAPSPKPDSGLGNSDPVQISSDSFRSKTPTVRRNFGRISEEEKVQESNIDVPTQSLISTEEDSSLSERSQNDESRNLAYVTIDRSRARGKTSNDRSVSSSSSSQSSPVVRTSTSSTEEVSKDQGNRVRGLEYVTIQRGVSSRKKLLSKVTTAASPSSLPSSTEPSIESQTESNVEIFVVESTVEGGSSTSTRVSSSVKDSLRSTISDEILISTETTTSLPQLATSTLKNKGIFDEENILNITVHKTISETLRLPHRILFRPQSSKVSSIRVKTTTGISTSEETVLDTTTISTILETIPSTETTRGILTTTQQETTLQTTTLSPTTTTTVNKIQALINQRKQSGKKGFFLNKAIKEELEETNEIIDSETTASASPLKNSPFKRPGSFRTKFPRKNFGKVDISATTTINSITTTIETEPSTTERNGFVKPSRPTNRLFNKFVSRGTIGKLSKEEKTTTQSTEAKTKSLVTRPATRSTLRSFIPTRPFAFRPSNGFKPIDLSAAPSKKSISQERSSLIGKSLSTEETDIPSLSSTTPEVESTTAKLTVGKILANLHGESTTKPESSTLRPKSFKPKFQRNKLREKLRHQLQEENEVSESPSEETETSTAAPTTTQKTVLPGIRINSKITPRRFLGRPSPKLSKTPRTLSTTPSKSSPPSRFQPTPRRNLRNRFSPTSIGFSRQRPSSLPTRLSTTTTRPSSAEPSVKVLSNEDIAEKLGLVPTPIPFAALDDESLNVIEATTSEYEDKNLLSGLLNSETKPPVPTEKSSIETLLKSAIVSSSVPRTSSTASPPTRVPFFPFAPPQGEVVNEDNDVKLEDNFVGPLSRPSFSSRRNSFKKRGRKIKRRRGQSTTTLSPSTEVPSTTETITTQRRQFSRRPISLGRQRGRFNAEEATTTPVPESSGQSEEFEDTVNEVEPKPRRRRPDFSRRRNIGKLSNKNITDKGRDLDFDSDNSKSTASPEENEISQEENQHFKTSEKSIESQNETSIEYDAVITTEKTSISSRITLSSNNEISTTQKPEEISTSKLGKNTSKSIYNKGRKPFKFSGSKRQKEDETNTEAPISFIASKRSSFGITSTTQILETSYPKEIQSTFSSILNEVEISTTESYDSSVREFSLPADPSTTAQPNTTTKKSIFSRRNRPSFLKSRPIVKQTTTASSILDSLNESETYAASFTPSLSSSSSSLFARTTTQSIVIEPSQSSQPRSLFKRPFNRPKLPFFQRKNSSRQAKESQGSAKVLSSSSTAGSLTSSDSPLSLSSTTPTTSNTLLLSTQSRSPFQGKLINKRPRDDYAFSTTQLTDETDPLNNSIEYDLLPKVKSEVEKESHLQDAEESAEDAESLEERLRQRLQQRKIKKSQNRSSLFNNPPRRPSFIRSRQPTTSTESSSVFVPTVSSTSSITITTTPTRVEEVSVQFNIQEEEDEELQNIITTNTVSPTIAITEPTQTTTQISSTARPFRRLRPISSSFSSPPTPLTTPPSFSSPSSPRRVSLRPDSPSPRPNRFRSKPFGPFPRPSSRPNRVRPIPRNPTPSSLTTPEPVVLLEFTTPIPQPTRSRLQPSPAQTFTPIPITFSPSSPQSLASSVSPSIPLFVSQSPEPSTSSPILVIEFSSTTPSQTSPSSFSSSQYPPSSSTPSPRSARPQPRRLNAFRNRFQVSPSSPSPIISKSREEELFTKVRQEQNALRLNRPSKGPISQNIPRRTTTTISTTAEISTDSTTIRSTPQPTTFKTTPAFRLSPSPLRTTPATSRPRVPSRSRSRPRPRPRPRPTTTTQAPKEYEYYYEDFPEEGNNGIGGLKSVDPFYDYELTPLSNKVSITSAGIKCHDVGVFQHPGSCKKFIRCSRRTSQGRIEGWEYECPNFLVFDPVGGRCNWAAEVDCS